MYKILDILSLIKFNINIMMFIIYKNIFINSKGCIQ